MTGVNNGHNQNEVAAIVNGQKTKLCAVTRMKSGSITLTVYNTPGKGKISCLEESGKNPVWMQGGYLSAQKLRDDAKAQNGELNIRIV